MRILVDIVVFATRLELDETKLTTAIGAEWGSRGLAGVPTPAILPEWTAVYPKAVKDVHAVEGYEDFKAASDSVYRLVLPPCRGMVSGQVWRRGH